MVKKITKNVGATERVISLALGAWVTYRALRDLRYRSVPALASGAYLLVRGGLGYCPISRWLGKKDFNNPAINLRAVMTVNRPREMVYAYWRNLTNLPSFMAHLKEVVETDESHSHWVIEMPGVGGRMEWDAEIVKDEPNRLIGWQSVNGAAIKNAGKVAFQDAPRGGTEVRVVFSYHPPAGGLGTGIAKLFTPVFKGVIEDEILNFKRVIEAGEIPPTKGQRATDGKTDVSGPY